ncbi:Six-hairpin glycosidase, partial [Fusarium albosuccineum]
MKNIIRLSALLPLFDLPVYAQTTDILEQHFANDADWYRDRIPIFECSDKSITDVYYYRWKIFRTHQRNISSYGYITTEFFDNVSWQTQPWASLNDAAHFHLNEGRWCRDPRYKQDYATFMYSKDSNARQYTESLAAAVWNNYLVDGNPELAFSLLQNMQDNYEGIDASGAKDGFTGGESFRPTINSYQIANARAIASIAKLKGGQQAVVDKYNDRADALKKRVQDDLWNSTLNHFIDRYYKSTDFVKYWEPIRGRELAGIVPWTHDVPDDNEDYAKAWEHVFDSKRLAGAYGLRTVEPSYEHYMRVWRYEGDHVECHWNGPSWPYQTTQVLTALGNVLDYYPMSAKA